MHRSFIKEAIPVLPFFLLGAFLANLPLFAFNRIYCSEDLLAYFQWTREFAMGLRDGVLVPRWDVSAMDGLGGPSFFYYPPLFFYVAGIFQLLGLETWISIRIVVFIVTFAMGYSMYFLLKRYVSIAWSFAGASAFIFSPVFHHIVSIQNLLPFACTSLTFVWFLSASLSVDSIRPSLAVSASLAALTLTHQLGGFMALICLPFLFLPSIIKRDDNAWPRFFGWGFSCVLGLMLTGYFILPSILGMNWIQQEDWFETFHVDWRNSFIVPVITLIQFGMRWFGIQWGLGGLAVCMLMITASGSYFIAHKRIRSPANTSQIQPGVLAAAVIATFFATEISFPLWRHVGMLHLIHWPYRFLVVLIPLVILSLALVADRLKSKKFSCCAMATIILFPALSVFLQVKNLPFMTKPDFASMHVSKRYARPAQVGQEWKTYLKNGSLSGECEVHGVEIVQDKIETHYAKWTFNSSNETTIRLPVFFFPAWRLTSNDVPLRTDYDLETGLIKISLKPGINEIALDWNMLVMERAGWLLTITSTAFLIAFTVTEKRTAKSR